MPTRFRILLLSLAAASLACQTVLGPTAGPAPAATRIPRPSVTPRAAATTAAPEPEPTLALGVTVQPPAFDTPGVNAAGVRACAYAPGNPVAQMPAEVVSPATPAPHPTPEPPSPSAVDAATQRQQARILRELWEAVRDGYVYPDYNGRDWDAIGAQYEAYVQAGLSAEDFHPTLQAMLNELGDNHSFILTPEDVAAQADGQMYDDYVGIGALVVRVPDTGPHGEAGVLTTIFPGSPAEQAGLRSHDLILAVDGGPLFDETTGDSRTLGPEGTDVTVTVQRPGEAAREVTIRRGRVNAAMPIDYCLVPGTRIGYIFFPTFEEETIDDQTRAALEAMTADGPLDGLILDNRLNGGGSSTVADPIMGFFTAGVQGDFVSREQTDPLRVRPEDVGGSQTVPLVVLVDTETASYGEIVSGVLRVAGRARIVGQVTYGNVERLWGYELEDGSLAYIASETFQPRGEANGVWEQTGIIPDVLRPTRWDLFTEANDPALAAAVDLLLKRP